MLILMHSCFICI